jgi:hypothetical protein
VRCCAGQSRMSAIDPRDAVGGRKWVGSGLRSRSREASFRMRAGRRRKLRVVRHRKIPLLRGKSTSCRSLSRRILLRFERVVCSAAFCTRGNRNLLKGGERQQKNAWRTKQPQPRQVSKQKEKTLLHNVQTSRHRVPNARNMLKGGIRGCATGKRVKYCASCRRVARRCFAQASVNACWGGAVVLAVAVGRAVGSFKRRIASFACVWARCLASPKRKFAGNAFPSFWPRFAGAWARKSAAPASKLANIFKRGSVEINTRGCTRQRRRSARFVSSHAMHLGASAPRNAGGGGVSTQP